MGLLDDLETQLEPELPLQLPVKLQQALDHYQPQCSRCALAMHRHHRYERTISPSYGPVRGSGSGVSLWAMSPTGGRRGTAGAGGSLPTVLKKLGTGL